MSPTMVADYTLHLPDKAILQSKLRELTELALESGEGDVGDKAYGTKSIRTYITGQRASYTIPPKSNVIEPWFCDFHTYKERHLIECFFNKTQSFPQGRYTL